MTNTESILDGSGIELEQLARLVAEHVVHLLQAPPASSEVLIDAAEGAAAASSCGHGRSASHWTKTRSRAPTRSMRICG
jgi:hypothetical protein